MRFKHHSRLSLLALAALKRPGSRADNPAVRAPPNCRLAAIPKDRLAATELLLLEGFKCAHRPFARIATCHRTRWSSSRFELVPPRRLIGRFHSSIALFASLSASDDENRACAKVKTLQWSARALEPCWLRGARATLAGEPSHARTCSRVLRPQSQAVQVLALSTSRARTTPQATSAWQAAPIGLLSESPAHRTAPA